MATQKKYLKIDDIRKYSNIHMTGIKGVGMTALAEILLANGFNISGSDVEEKFMTDEVLERLDIAVKKFNIENISGKEAVVRSNAYDESNPEIAEANRLSIPVFSYPEVVAQFFNSIFGIAIAGSHGKTTTTAMLSHILKSADKNVTAIVGSKVINWGCGAVSGNLSAKDAFFILEADEYKEAFLNYRPKGAIITNIDYDHPDYYPDKKSYINAFSKFISLIPKDGFIVADSSVVSLLQPACNKCKIVSVDLKEMIDFDLKVFGEHNIINANMAYRAALEIGISPESARAAIENFNGTSRRMEFLGEKNGLLIFDDYAHHPAEIAAALSALRQKYGDKKIIAIFQPHTYSRTKYLFNDFVSAFSDANIIILTNIYASAREQKQGQNYGVNMEDMVLALHSAGKDAILIKDKNAIADYLKNNFTNENAVAVTLGAGDVGEVAYALIQKSKCKS